MNINIGLFGCVSVGKSTLLNAMMSVKLSDTEIKKTTLVPQVYTGSGQLSTNPTVTYQEIRDNNRECNNVVEKILDDGDFTLDKCQSQTQYHIVDEFVDFFEPESITNDMVINVYDIPGLNDSSSKSIYYEWVKNNAHIFDILIFMTDINRGLSDSDELEILKLLMQIMRKHESRMICLINKCDDIYYDDSIDDFVFEDMEQQNIYIQANNILADIAKQYGFTYGDGYFTSFLPVSCENCYIYRALIKNPELPLDQVHVNRLCKSECGLSQWKRMDSVSKQNIFMKFLSELKTSYEDKIRDTGYIAVRSAIRKTISDCSNLFARKKILQDMSKLSEIKLGELDVYYNNITHSVETINQASLKNISVSFDDLWNIIKQALSDCTDVFVAQYTPKTLSSSTLDVISIFNNIEKKCASYSELIKFLNTISDYQKHDSYIKSKFIKIINHTVTIYNIWLSRYYAAPTYLPILSKLRIKYLNFLKTYDIDNFEKVMLQMLHEWMTMINMHSIEVTMNDENMGLFLYYVVKNIDLKKYDLSYILCRSFFMRIKYIETMEQRVPYSAFVYMLQLRLLIRKITTLGFSAFTIFEEYLNRQISTCRNKPHDISVMFMKLDSISWANLRNDDSLFDSRIVQYHAEYSKNIEFETKLLNKYFNNIQKN